MVIIRTYRIPTVILGLIVQDKDPFLTIKKFLYNGMGFSIKSFQKPVYNIRTCDESIGNRKELKCRCLDQLTVHENIAFPSFKFLKY